MHRDRIAYALALALAGVCVCLPSMAHAGRTRFLLDNDWKFALDAQPYPACQQPNTTFPIDKNDQQCMGLSQVSATSLDDCINACCADDTCEVYQYCASSSCGSVGACWIGQVNSCQSGNGWVSRARSVTPPPPSTCTEAWCNPNSDDTAWRSLNIPHDFVVEGNFTSSADKSHGYLPFGVGYYRKHFHLDESTITMMEMAQEDRLESGAGAAGGVMWLDFEGVQTTSTVFLNGHYLGTHASGYTPSRYFLNASVLVVGANVLAVKADARNPDGWWYDGGGIYRHVWLTTIATPGPYIAPWGVYVPSQVSGPTRWSPVDGTPHADALVFPSIELWNNASTTATVAINLVVYEWVRTTKGGGALGNIVAKASGSTIVPGKNGAVVWSPIQPIALPNASLWHLVNLPATPALYVLSTNISIDGTLVDSQFVRFGVRNASFDAANGFFLNGVPTKILGTANHQDFAGIGVAIPDHLQAHRILKLKDMGVNGWRTAHNPPNVALLDATDEIGMVVWDENHRNGQDAECELLIRRDRNHPSVVIWSLCNEVLCNTNDWVADALRLKALIRRLDPLGHRPVSANQNGWVGPNTPLDLQGFDYSTNNYDQWHHDAPHIPSMSSETSSAVSDRGEYVSDGSAGYVAAYDNTYPSWGESTQQAWGGYEMPDDQGILTRSFISGGWTWTGWDYKGEPTPYGWPDINSHFGILDIAGFPKDRFYWYRAWFVQPKRVPEVWLFPHWSWENKPFNNLPIWVYSNADEVELFVNGETQGRKSMPKYGHIEWTDVKYTPGTLKAVAYIGGVQSGNATHITTGNPSALRISVKDNVGTTLIAGCNDVALVQVEVVDAQGNVVPEAANEITFNVQGAGTLIGTGNGDPASHVNDKSAIRPVFHGLVLGVIGVGTTPGNIVIRATSTGLPAASLVLVVAPQPQPFLSYWCHNGPAL